MASTHWGPLVGWVGAIGIAVALALAAPSERNLLGKVPSLSAKRLDQTHMVFPQQLPSERTLAVVVFRRDQREEAQGWIDGLGLHQGSDISWVRMPMWSMRDPQEREKIEQHLLQRYPSQADQARLLPVFTDREAFVRSAGLGSTAHAAVLVLDRDGNVLARAQGPYDEKKAQALRETLLGTTAAMF